MAEYRFLTTWCLDAPIGEVFAVLADTQGYPTWKSVLPYTLTFDIRATRVERPYLLEGEASGELDGVGVWRLFEGRGTAVTYDWRVRTTKRWMNVLGPLPRPAFAWNHDLVMRQGGVGLARKLGVPLLLSD